jgi:glycosyltransferase involved in cell wall biosynthesis
VPVPRVSVVIPNYNYAKTLALCLESVFAQTLAPYEVIVADDASTDGSVRIAERFPCRVLRAERNGGVSAARNAGVRASTGEVLFFVDSDEALAPDAVEQAVRLLAEDPGLGCVHGIIAPEPLIDDGPVEWYRTLHAHHWRKRAVGPTPTAYFAATAMPRPVFDAVGPFNEALRDSEDVEYSDRLSAQYRIVLTDRVVARHDEEDRLWPMLREQFGPGRSGPTAGWASSPPCWRLPPCCPLRSPSPCPGPPPLCWGWPRSPPQPCSPSPIPVWPASCGAGAGPGSCATSPASICWST